MKLRMCGADWICECFTSSDRCVQNAGSADVALDKAAADPFLPVVSTFTAKDISKRKKN